MHTLATCAAILLLALVGGCANMRFAADARFAPTKLDRCQWKDCFTSVNVNRCTIEVLDERREIGSNDTRLVWTLDDPSLARGYRFADNGIRIKSDPHNQFSGGHAFAGKTAYVVIDRNSADGKGEFPYGLNIVGPAGACPERDPFIVNN